MPAGEIIRLRRQIILTTYEIHEYKQLANSYIDNIVNIEII